MYGCQQKNINLSGSFFNVFLQWFFVPVYVCMFNFNNKEPLHQTLMLNKEYHCKPYDFVRQCMYLAWQQNDEYERGAGRERGRSTVTCNAVKWSIKGLFTRMHTCTNFNVVVMNSWFNIVSTIHHSNRHRNIASIQFIRMAYNIKSQAFT